ncbi:hypothetical protein T11_13769 [Trichinella zimbabwensis]|uniref:Uncharacterized protein n=1 Tax=Trichinella zimbabwensis TaxID=268475 RepID=A0A0V1G8C3_9BILA|nr:hypothetical protein T11_13769 [Trichinella zimbabwensis]
MTMVILSKNVSITAASYRERRDVMTMVTLSKNVSKTAAVY